MKRMLQALLLVGSCSLLAAGCSSSETSAAKPVADMLQDLYFGEGTYQTYQENFKEPDKVISEPEFNKIRSAGAAKLFDGQSFEQVHQNLRAFLKDEQTAVVYWVDFTQDKSKDLHWNVAKTEQGWKIQN